MNSENAALRLLAYADSVALEPRTEARGWTHMGAIICDAALQPRSKYKTTVRPRIRRLIEVWPEADTVTRFRMRLQTDDISEALRWRGPTKLKVIRDMSETLDQAGVDTANELRLGLAESDTGQGLRSRLRAIHRVGPKTIDYLSILSGSLDHVATDVHVRGFMTLAGVPPLSYQNCVEVIRRAATMRGWRPGALDAAIWDYMTSGPGPRTAD